jgi:cytoskeletal protein CcmA (bactofilin family)
VIRRRFQFQGPQDEPEPDAQVRTDPAAPSAPPERPGQPVPRPNQPVRNVPTPTKAPQSKEADLSHRPESIQSVPRSGSDQTVTVIGNGARLEGNLIAAASLRIEGTVTGTITADGDVIVAPEAEVAADIQSTNTTLGGHYTGNVVATGTIELTSTARVEGNLTCRSLIVNQGAIFSGQSIMDSGVKKPAAVPAAATSPAPQSSPPSSPPSSSSSSSSSPSR